MKTLRQLPRPLFPADTAGKIRSLAIFRNTPKRSDVPAMVLAGPARALPSGEIDHAAAVTG